MEAGDIDGHGKLPRLSSSSSSEMNHQGLASDQVAIGRPASRTNSNNSNGAGSEECTVREQDQLMPIANVIRIMRRVLPPYAKVSDDAKETVQECVSEFIGFITGEANERCQHEQRKTITAEDMLWAMAKLGFDDYVEPLTIYLHRYRDLEGDRGPLRGDSLPKRNYDFTPRMGFAAPPGFHMAAHPRPPVGYYGPPPPPPASNGGGSAAQQGGAPGFGPYGQQNKE